jgi:MSHA biogenesis protein MshQ
MAVQAEYWSGSSWLLNSADGCTTLAASAVGQSNKRGPSGAATSAWSTTASAISLSSGSGTLTLSAPSPAGTGTVDISLNLGSTAVDNSCVASPPATTGAARPWLRSQYGGCSAAWDRDPSARASFGIFSPESRKTVHLRELF